MRRTLVLIVKFCFFKSCYIGFYESSYFFNPTDTQSCLDVCDQGILYKFIHGLSFYTLTPGVRCFFNLLQELIKLFILPPGCITAHCFIGLCQWVLCLRMQVLSASGSPCHIHVQCHDVAYCYDECLVYYLA